MMSSFFEAPYDPIMQSLYFSVIGIINGYECSLRQAQAAESQAKMQLAENERRYKEMVSRYG